MAEQEQDVDALKRRGRRRLVGAVALALAAVIVLPMVFDPEPRPSAPVSVRIPGEDEAPFKPKPPAVKPKPKAEVSKPEAPKPEPKAEAPKPEAAKPESKAAERARAEAALRGGEQYYVPVGAFANPETVVAKLTEAKVPYYTEDLAVAGGRVTRVRAGPFASKAAAEKTAGRLKGMGFKPGAVAAKSG